ncbi:MAG TPA: DUF1501 domain-containing protein [Gemmataceae bacterium]|nr:DUF1501 domain-containing protein [Gemmataceae bacterium]
MECSLRGCSALCDRIRTGGQIDTFPEQNASRARRCLQSDEWSWRAVDPLSGYDLHATILHLLGIDHARLTVRHNGTNRRLTDVHGHVMQEILA